MRTASSSPGSDRVGRVLLAGALLAALAGGLPRLLARSPRPASPEAVARVVASPPRAQVRPAPSVRAGSPAEGHRPQVLPASLAGTEEDGALRTNDAGDLIVEPAVLCLFDYYLSATGEESPAVIRARIVSAIQRRNLGARGEGQAVALLDTYLGYREAARGLRAPGDDPEGRLTVLRDLRRRSFGADAAEKLFGREERVLAVAIERRRLLADRSMPEADRATHLARLDADLPADVQRARAEATRPLRERADEEAMRASGATDDDLRAVRVASYGEEAADRLAALDGQRAAWKARLASFRDARAAALQAESDPARREAAVQAILDASFTPLEQIRVRASGAL